MKISGTRSGMGFGAAALLILAAIAACTDREDAPAPPSTSTLNTPPEGASPVPTVAEPPLPPTASPYDALPEAVRLAMDKPFTGDFDAMIKRRAIRVGVTFNRTHYFIDKGHERGLT